MTAFLCKADCVQLQHINCLEIRAVVNKVKHAVPQLQNKSALIWTVVKYINMQEGTKQESLRSIDDSKSRRHYTMQWSFYLYTRYCICLPKLVTNVFLQ